MIRDILKRLFGNSQIAQRSFEPDDGWLRERELILAVPTHRTGLTSLTFSLQARVSINAENQSQTGSAFGPTTNVSGPSLQYSIGTSSGNTTSGGGDEASAFQQTVVAGGSATIDLSALMNTVGQSPTIARVKGCFIQLLSAANDPTISPAPTATSTCVVTNNGPAVPHPLYFASKGSGLTLALTQSGGALTGVAIGVAGSGYPPSSTFIVAPNQAGGSGGVVTVTTNGSGVPTAVAVAAGGAGYSNATVPCTELGKFSLNTGDGMMMIDTSANGLAISSTSKNIKIINNDASHAITPQFSFPLASS